MLLIIFAVAIVYVVGFVLIVIGARDAISEDDLLVTPSEITAQRAMLPAYASQSRVRPVICQTEAR